MTAGAGKMLILGAGLCASAVLAATPPTPASATFDDRPVARQFEHPAWFKPSFLILPDDLAQAAAAGKTGIIVYFGQENCAYCEALMATSFGAEQDIVEYTRRHFDVIATDIRGSRELTDLRGRRLTEARYAERERTHFTPSLLFYDARGVEALRLRGYYPPYRLRAALKFVVNGFYRHETFRDYLLRADPPPKFELDALNEQPFFTPPPYALERSRMAAERPLAVFFEQRNCHACDILHTGPLGDPVTRRLLRQFDVVQLDMWSDTPVWTPGGERLTARAWGHTLGLYYAPTLLFFDQHGMERIRIDSVVHLYRLRGVLEYVLAGGYLQAPTYQRWRALRGRLPAGD